MASLLKPGQLLAGYEVIALVGKGGMGEVYRARQISMDRAVALKVLTPKLVQRDPTFAQRFVDEARSAGRLNHPNIVGVHDVGETTITTEVGEEPVHYFSMEFVEGETIKDVIARNGALPIAQIGEIMTAMVEALGYAEAQGVVHRDIKPENIMVSPNGDVKLADLGLAQQVGSENQDTEGKGRKVMGTPMYMSPEQARGLVVGHASDQYSLGATLFHMLTGKPPFMASDGRELMRAHVRDPVPDPKLFAEVSEPWRQACMRMMAKTVDERFANVGELRAATKGAILGEATGPSKRMRTGRTNHTGGLAPIGMAPAMRNALTGAVIVAVVLVAFFVMSLGRPAPQSDSRNVRPPPNGAGGDPTVDKAKILIASLPGEPGAALTRLDKALGDTTLSQSARDLLDAERSRRQQQVATRDKGLIEAQNAVLERIDQRIGAGQLAQARSEFDAAAAEQPDRVAQRRSETAARLDQAVAALVQGLIGKIESAGDEQGVGRYEGEAATAPLSAEQRGKIAEVVTSRRAQLAKVAQSAAAVAAAGPRWAALAEAIEPLRCSTRYDELRVIINASVENFQSPEAQTQAKALLDLASLGRKGEDALRNHAKTRKPQVTLRVNKELKKVILVEVTDKELQVKAAANAAMVRIDRAATVFDGKMLLMEALAGADAKERDRIIASCLFLWDPPAAVGAFKVLGDDLLAQAFTHIESRRKGPLLAGRVLRQDAGRVQVLYDFLPGDRGPLADFIGENIDIGERGLIWKNTRTVPQGNSEASLPTLRWKRRLQPPLKICATIRIASDIQGTLIGVDSGAKLTRLSFGTMSPGVVTVGPIFTDDGAVFTGVDPLTNLGKILIQDSKLDLSQPIRVDAVVDDKYRLKLSYNGVAVEKDRQIAKGDVGWVFQLYQKNGPSTLEIETLSLEGKLVE